MYMFKCQDMFKWHVPRLRHAIAFMQLRLGLGLGLG